MKRLFNCILVCILISVFMISCDSRSYKDGYRDGYADGCQANNADSYNDSLSSSIDSTNVSRLPLIVAENDIYELALMDVYLDEESSIDSWSDEEKNKQYYIFKFRFRNKHESSNIRAALVQASINGYSLSGSSACCSDDSFSVYTWSGDNPSNTAVECFRLCFDDIEASTNVRDAENMDSVSLSFIFRVYIIDEMDDYGEDQHITIENAFQYCS